MVPQLASWVCFRTCKTLNLLYFFFFWAEGQNWALRYWRGGAGDAQRAEGGSLESAGLTPPGDSDGFTSRSLGGGRDAAGVGSWSCEFISHFLFSWTTWIKCYLKYLQCLVFWWFWNLCHIISSLDDRIKTSFIQKHVMAVVDGVTLVAAVSLKVLQDGDTYSSLLDIAHRLHGENCLVLWFDRFNGNCTGLHSW